MIVSLLNIAFYLLVVATLPGIWRMARGPTVVDRVLAFDAVVLCSVGEVVLLSRLWGTPLYLDLILIISSLGFLSTVALVLYLQVALPGKDDEKKEGEA